MACKKIYMVHMLEGWTCRWGESKVQGHMLRQAVSPCLPISPGVNALNIMLGVDVGVPSQVFMH
jgi:hypothetical protein